MRFYLLQRKRERSNKDALLTFTFDENETTTRSLALDSKAAKNEESTFVKMMCLLLAVNYVCTVVQPCLKEGGVGERPVRKTFAAPVMMDPWPAQMTRTKREKSFC